MSKNRRFLIISMALVSVMALAGAAMAFTTDSPITADSARSGIQVERPLFIQDADEGDSEEAAPEFGRRGRSNGLRGVIDRDAMTAAIAETLGLTVEELEAAHEDGQNIEELAEAAGVTMEEVQAAIEAVRTDAINQAVEDGTITQEQADQILSGEGRGFGKGFGRGEGRRGNRLPNFIDRDAMSEAVADALGVTVEEMEAAKESADGREAFAEALGVTTEEIEAAKQAAMEEAVSQAVAEGVLTQEQADQILSGEGRFGKGHGRGGARLPNFIDADAMKTAVADALGVTVEELDEAREATNGIAELAEELGLTEEDVQAAFQAAREEAVNQAVEEGIITQEQADQILSGEGRNFGRGFGNGSGRGFRGQGGFQGLPFGGNDGNADNGFNLPGLDLDTNA